MDVKIYSVESGFISDCDEVPFNIIWKGSVLILLAILPLLEEVKAGQCHVTNNKKYHRMVCLNQPYLLLLCSLKNIFDVPYH